MKSFSKRVASFAMAAAMVLSLAAVSPVDAQAAKKASITKKSSIKAGKAYTYNIKNVTSKQYVKVTGITSGVKVKYNNKTVKKNSTKIYGKKSGAALALKVTAKDKVANYKATIKAQVYNKSNHKKVGSLLKTTATVKCTKLKVNSVESASTTGKYLVATFNKALSKLSVADITIRNKETGELKGVAAVSLASDGKSATITLTGSEDGARNQFVTPNIEYTFTVAQSGATATTTFVIDGVMANASVVNVDAVNRTLQLANWNQDNNAWASRITVPASINIDFQDILGASVNVKFDKNNAVKDITRVKETTVEGAFKAVTANTIGQTYLEDLATGTKYYLQTASGMIDSSAVIYKTATGYGHDADNETAAGVVRSALAEYLGRTVTPVTNYTTNHCYDYMKLTLDASGAIRTAVVNNKFDGQILVDKVVDNTVSAGTKTTVNLKDYLIVKDGKTIKVSDIAVGDMVYYDKTNKFANVYNNSTTGALEAVYKNQFKFGGKVYTTNKVQYVDGSNGVKSADDSYMNDLKAGKQDITVYFNRKNEPVYVAGTKGVAVTNTTTIVLTDAIKTYNSVLKDVIRIKGFNGTEIKEYDINVSDLNTIIDENNKKFTSVSNNKGNSATEFYGVNFQASNFNTSASIAVSRNDQGAALGTITPANLAAKKGAIQITTNDKGVVVGINCKPSVGTVSGNFTAGASKLTVTANTGVYGDYQISGTAKVYTYTNDTTVSVVNYADFAQKVAAPNAVVYSANGKDVDYIVALAIADADVNAHVKAVVSTVNKTTDGKNAVLEVVSGAETIKYESFSETAKGQVFATGDIVDIEVAKDGSVVSIKNASTMSNVSSNLVVSGNGVNVNDQTFVVSSNVAAWAPNGKTFTMATSVAPTIVEVVYDGTTPVSVKVISFNDLADLKKGSATANEIKVSTLGYSMTYVDTIVVTKK